MKRRYFIKDKKRLFAIVVMLTLIISVTFFASRAFGYEVSRYDTVRVAKGDTLWDIAGKYRKNGDIRQYIYEIKKVNNLQNSVLYEGSELKIPF